MIRELLNQLRNYITSDDDLYDILHEAADTIESLSCNSGWILCGERLPEEKINPITQDYYTYPVTFLCEGVTDIKYYSFGNGHWRFGQMIMDDYVIAWQPLQEPYKPESEG